MHGRANSYPAPNIDGASPTNLGGKGMKHESRRSAAALSFLTATELRALLDKSKDQNARDYCMLLVAYRHGLRASEICGLDVDDIDIDDSHIVCNRLKGSISNWQKLGRDEVSAIHAWLKSRPESASEAVFVDDEGKRLSRFQLYRVFRRHAKAAGIPEAKCHPHVLKHSLGTHLANAGVPVQVIQQRLGHRCISSTMQYLAIASEFVDRTVAAAIDAGAVV